MNNPLTNIQNSGTELHLGFELDEKTYALNAEYVMEVMMLPSLITPQRLPENTVGILNYNGILLNVIDIRKVLNLSAKPYETSNQMIIIKGEESLFAMIVDKVSDFITPTLDDVQTASFDISHSFIKSFYRCAEKIIHIINIVSLETELRKTKEHENTTNYHELFPKDKASTAILDKRSTQIAAKMNFNIDTDFYGKDKYVTFKVNEHVYCIYSSYVKELTSLKNYVITKIPYTPNYTKGIINLKGDFYTVVSLKEFIGLGNKSAQNEDKIIVLDAKDLKLALLVDDILDVMNVSKEQIQNKNDMRLDELYIQAEIYCENKIFNLLNIEKLINDKKLYIE